MVKYTKRHYIEIAGLLQKIENKEEQRKQTNRMITMFEQDNPKFDKTVFESVVYKKSPTDLTNQQKRRLNEFIRESEDKKLTKQLG